MAEMLLQTMDFGGCCNIRHMSCILHSGHTECFEDKDTCLRQVQGGQSQAGKAPCSSSVVKLSCSSTPELGHYQDEI